MSFSRARHGRGEAFADQQEQGKGKWGEGERCGLAWPRFAGRETATSEKLGENAAATEKPRARALASIFFCAGAFFLACFLLRFFCVYFLGNQKINSNLSFAEKSVKKSLCFVCSPALFGFWGPRPRFSDRAWERETAGAPQPKAAKGGVALTGLQKHSKHSAGALSLFRPLCAYSSSIVCFFFCSCFLGFLGFLQGEWRPTAIWTRRLNACGSANR